MFLPRRDDYSVVRVTKSGRTEDGTAIPEKGNSKNGNSFFFHQRHALWMSFHIFVVTCRVTNFLPKLIYMQLFSEKKPEFPFFVFPYFRVLPDGTDAPESVPKCRFSQQTIAVCCHLRRVVTSDEYKHGFAVP